MKTPPLPTRLLFILTLLLAGSVAATPEAVQPPDATAAATARPMTALDLLDLQRPLSPRLSPDGRQVLFSMAHADWQRNRAVTDLWRVGSNDHAPQRIIAHGGSGAIWAPDSRRFAYITRRSTDKARQIYIKPVDGGKATRLTHSPTSVSNLSWPGQGRYLYFLANEPVDQATRQRLKSHDDMFLFESERSHRALWRVDAGTGNQEVLVHGDFDVGDYDVAADGRTVLYRRSPSKLHDDEPRSELWLYQKGQPSRQLTHNNYIETAPHLSPDAHQVLFLASAEDNHYATVNARLFVLDIASGRIRELQHGRPWKIENAQWRGDGSEIVFSATTGVRRELFAVDVANDQLHEIARGDFAVSSFSIDDAGRNVVYAAASATNPGELYFASLQHPAAADALTGFNDHIGERFRLPRQQAIQWTAADGQPLEGLLTYPLDYVPGRRYPLIVQNHGGPRSADVFGIFAYGRFNPVLAAYGYMSLRVNYRGGTGYGDKFLQGMNGGYFKYADSDVLSGVDHVVALGLADPDKLGVMGWSAGGHMTNRLITVTDRFKAAASGAGVVDWTSMYLTSDTRWQRQEWFVTPPYGSKARRDLYTQYSPLTSLDKVHTPTLILAGHEDPRVPPAQSVMLYRALKALGVDTQLYLAPREPHNFRELQHRLFQINKQMDWFDRYLGGSGYRWSVPPAEAAQQPAAKQKPAVESENEPEPEPEPEQTSL